MHFQLPELGYFSIQIHFENIELWNEGYLQVVSLLCLTKQKYHMMEHIISNLAIFLQKTNTFAKGRICKYQEIFLQSV